MAPSRMFCRKSSTCIVQRQLSTAIHFRKLLQEIPLVESFFCSNYRLTPPTMFSWKSSENFWSSKISQIVNIGDKFNISSKGGILWMSNICLHEGNLCSNHIFFSSFPGIFLVYNVLINMKKVIVQQ